MTKERTVASVIILIALMGKVLGFLRELLLANYFGTSSLVDIYLMSVTIPSILFGFLPAIGTAFTPIYYEIGEKKRQSKFLNNLLVASIVIALTCIILAYFTDDCIVAFCAPGFSETAKTTTVSFLRITIWIVLFNTPVQILVAFLNCRKDYINSNLSNLTVSLTQAIFVVIAAYTKPIFLPIGALLPWIFQFLWLLFSSVRQGFHPSLRVTKDIYVYKLLFLAIPICISNFLVDLNGFVDKTLSSSLPEGRLSALNYAFTIRAIFVTVSTTVLATIYYPKITELTSKKDSKDVVGLVEKLMDIIMIIIVPINIFCMIFGREVIQIVLMRGNFDFESLTITFSPFIMYMLSLSFILLRELIIRVMYANGETKANLFFGAINIGTNVILSICFIGKMEHTGLALATSAAAILTFPLYIRKLRKLVPNINLKKRLSVAGKVVLASLIMGVSAYTVNLILSPLVDDTFFSAVFRSGICLVVGLIAYTTMIVVLRVGNLATILNKIMKKIKRSKHD